MDYNAQWNRILKQGNFSTEFVLILPDGYEVTLYGVESAGDNGNPADGDISNWTYEHTYSTHSLSVPADDFYEALGTDNASDCLVELRSKRYRIAGVTGTEVQATVVRLWLKPVYDDGEDA